MNFLTEELMAGQSWRAFERAVARWMGHCGWSDVRIIAGSGDGGGDVLAVRNEGGVVKKYVVQAKCMSGVNYVGPAAIDQVLEAQGIYGCDVAAVATNGNFTDSAIKRKDILNRGGFDVKLWNGTFLKETIELWPEESPLKKALRPYQEKIVESTLANVRKGQKRTHFIVATGLGKTVIASDFVNRMISVGYNRVLVLCHARHLAFQLEQGFWSQIGKSVPTRIFYGGEPPISIEGINFGLFQTFVGYLPGVEPTDYDIVVVDEAHHAMAHGFRRCINHLKPHFLLGMTATPWRGDGENIEAIFGRPSDQLSVVDGMKLGFLAKVNYHVYCDTVNWSEVSQKAGPVSVRELNKRLFLPQRDDAIAAKLFEICTTISNPRIIIFCASIPHAENMSRLMMMHGMVACELHSGIPKREQYRILMDFSADKVNVLCTVDMLNEGIDVPDVNILVFLRATHSRRIFVQQLGRGLRITPEKKEVIVLDFVTDLRRLADVMEMDNEARRGITEQQVVELSDGIVDFENKAIVPFVQQWIMDIADLGDSDDTQLLEFPDIL